MSRLSKGLEIAGLQCKYRGSRALNFAAGAIGGIEVDKPPLRGADDAVRRSEKMLRQIADASPSLISYVNADEIYEFVNLKYINWYGKPAAEIIGRSVKELHGEEEYRTLKPSIDQAMSGKRVEFETELDDLESNPRYVQGYLIPDIDETGRVNGYTVVTTDLTDLKRREEELHQSQKMEALGQLTGGVAHDFNNLLAIIEGNLSLLTEYLGEDGEISTDKAQKMVKTALNASRRGAQLTHRLLAFSRKQVLEPKMLDLNEVVRGLESMLGRTLSETIDLRITLAGGNWKARADVSQLESAILNFVLNAQDAIEGEGRLTIKTTEEHFDQAWTDGGSEIAAGDYVVLEVSDTGRGMEPNVLDKVFEPFFTTKGVGKGSGLGLSMVYGFARQSGGHVAITSAPGEGTTIKLYLPRGDDEEAAPEPVRPAPPRREGAGGETILVVEDDKEVLRVVVQMLELRGYRVVEAEDGKTALEIYDKRGPFDLLLSDVILSGGMTGPEIAKTLVEISPGLKVLYMSGYTENAMARLGHLGTSEQLIRKPFSSNDLAAKVREILAATD